MANNNPLNGYMPDDDYYTVAEKEKAITAAHYPTCRFCGKQTIPVANYASNEEADEAATMACDCYKAALYRNEKEQESRREKNIVKLRTSINGVCDYCDEHNIKLADKFCELVLNAGIAVIDGVIEATSFKFARLNIKLSAGSKSAVVIKVTYSDGTQYEV